jgi:Uma2 family endonuclease
MIAERKLLTADDVWEMGEDAHVELLRGELREMPAGGGRHGGIGGEFAGELWLYGRETGLGRVFTSETGIIVSKSPTTLLVPDLFFIKFEHLPDAKLPVRFFEVPPDVVLEILSPSQRFADLLEKAAMYLKFGVPLVWLVDADRKAITALTGDGVVRVYHLGDILDGGDVLPGFSVPVDRLFP